MAMTRGEVDVVLKRVSWLGMFFCGLGIIPLMTWILGKRGFGARNIGLLEFFSMALYPAVGFLMKHCWKGHTRFYTSVYGEPKAAEMLKGELVKLGYLVAFVGAVVSALVGECLPKHLNIQATITLYACAFFFTMQIAGLMPFGDVVINIVSFTVGVFVHFKNPLKGIVVAISTLVCKFFVDYIKSSCPQAPPHPPDMPSETAALPPGIA